MTKRAVVIAVVVAVGCGSSSPKPTPVAGTPSPSPTRSPSPSPSPSPTPSPDPTPTPTPTPTPPSYPALAMVADAPCTIAENGKARNKLVLRYGGAPFAAIDTYDGADLELAANGATATMHVVTAELDLTGEVDLHDIHARPRATQSIDDWITIVDGVVTGATGDSITIQPHLNFVTLAGATTWTVPCAEATLTRYPPDPCCGDYAPDIRWLPRGRAVDIDREPGQTKLGTIRIAKKGEPWDGRVERFETKGAWSHVTYDDGDVIITGWVKTAVLATKKQDYGNGRGLYGHVVSAVRDGDITRCDHVVDVSVERDGKTVRAGSIKAGTPLNINGIGDKGGYVYLGVSSDDRIDPTVPADQLVGCPAKHVGPK